jgi:hypothetical protein
MGQAANQRKFLSIKAKEGHGLALKNVLTVKVSHFWGPFGRKTGGGRALKKTIFFCFFVFWGFLAPEDVEAQDFSRICPLTKKSCLKTYGRFLGFCGFW